MMRADLAWLVGHRAGLCFRAQLVLVEMAEIPAAAWIGHLLPRYRGRSHVRESCAAEFTELPAGHQAAPTLHTS